jgi:hypothetical protein
MPAQYTPFLADIGKAIGQGITAKGQREQKQAEQALIQSAYMGQPGALEELYGKNPQAAQSIQRGKTQQEQQALQTERYETEQVRVGEQDKLKALQQLREMRGDIQKQVANMDNFEQASSYMDRQIETNRALIDAAGLKAEDIKLTPEAFEQIKKASKMPTQGTKSFQPITLKSTETGEKILASPTVDPNTGKAKLASYEIPPGYELSTETPEEKRAAEILAAGLKKIQETKGKTEEERAQITIDRAYEAADSIPVIQRSLDLLDMVDTGGFEAAQLASKRALGVESADEAELNYNLGKTVLTQLKATFGSAFTEAEGDRLARLEASLGKSAEGNKRILEQAKQIAMRAANRGVKTAKKRGDEDTVNELIEAISFRFEYGDKEGKEGVDETAKESATTKPAATISNQITIGDQTFSRPPGFTDQQWSDYKKSQGVQ